MEPATNYWCEEAPLFEVRVSSQKDLKQLLHLEGVIKEELATKIGARMMAKLQSPDSSAHPPALHVLVQPKVYLLVPDSHNKDGSITEVTEEDVLSSISLCIDNKVFDFGALFRACRTNPKRVDKGISTNVPLLLLIYYTDFITTGPSNLKELVDELEEVVGWYHFGLCLEVPDHQLQIISENYPRNTVMCKIEMLRWWMQNKTGKKWATVVQALVNTGSRVAACKVALKHGEYKICILYFKLLLPYSAYISLSFFSFLYIFFFLHPLLPLPLQSSSFPLSDPILLPLYYNYVVSISLPFILLYFSYVSICQIFQFQVLHRR